jgi:serine/threonine protein phosphatase PrpC
LRLIAHGKTDKGLVRKENEDAFCIEKDLGLLKSPLPMLFCGKEGKI